MKMASIAGPKVGDICALRDRPETGRWCLTSLTSR